MSRTLIRVTKKHIESGHQFRFNECPVALAVKEKMSTGYCGVFGGVIEWGNVVDQKAKQPESVIRFVDKFDSKGKKAVKPFNFYLRLPFSGKE